MGHRQCKCKYNKGGQGMWGHFHQINLCKVVGRKGKGRKGSPLTAWAPQIGMQNHQDNKEGEMGIYKGKWEGEGKNVHWDGEGPPPPGNGTWTALQGGSLGKIKGNVW